MFESLPLLDRIAVSVLPILFAITVHEVAHGWMAKRLGDPTAERLGRLTLNPIKHIDPIGTVLVPAALLLFKAPFLFGWAKPVPVTWENLRNPKRDMIFVAAAGPAANLLMAILWGVIAQLGNLSMESAKWVGEPLFYMGLVGILINVLLMVFNLLPLPPLDGGRVAVGLLPGRWAWHLSRIEPYGFLILLALIIPLPGLHVGLLWVIIGPVMNLLVGVIGSLVGLW